MIDKKIDFILTVEVCDANPNGDPLAGNMPRTDSDGYGVISDVAIKRKIRNRMQDLGKNIFVQSSERASDGFVSLQQRFENRFPDKNILPKDIEIQANAEWLDVRSFGQVFTFYGKAIGVRGPVSISMAKSLSPVVVSTMQITKSVNGQTPKKEQGKSSDTMGSKCTVDYGVYVIKGSVNCYFSEKTGFNLEDLELLKKSLLTLFENDASTARPEGSMRVKELFWFTHGNKLGNLPSWKIFDMLKWNNLDDAKDYSQYNIHLEKETLQEVEAKGVVVEIING